MLHIGDAPSARYTLSRPDQTRGATSRNGRIPEASASCGAAWEVPALGARHLRSRRSSASIKTSRSDERRAPREARRQLISEASERRIGQLTWAAQGEEQHGPAPQTQERFTRLYAAQARGRPSPAPHVLARRRRRAEDPGLRGIQGGHDA